MHEELKIIITLVNNAALLLAMGVLYDSINIKSKLEKTWQSVVFGLVIGTVCIALMRNPLKLDAGVVFDTRTILLSISGLFFGFIPTLIATIMAAILRLYMGGGGTVMGISTIVTSATIGYLWRIKRREHLSDMKWGELYIFGLTVHVVMLILMSTLPDPIKALTNLGIPVIVIFPIVTVLLGKLLSHQLSRKKAYISLAHNRGMLAHMMNSIPHFVFWKDRNSVYQGCNKAFAQAAGFDAPENIIGKTDLELPWLPEETHTYRVDDRDVMENNHPKYHIIEQQLQADGRRPWVDTSKIPLTDENGDVYGLLGIYEDITERKEAEEALRQSQGMLSHVLNSVPHHIFWKDLNSVYQGCNKAFAQAAGVGTPENIIGKTDFDFPWMPEEAQKYRHDDKEVMENNRPKLHLIEQQLQANGKHIWVDTTKLPLTDSNGKVCGVMGIYEDITERKTAEDEIQRNEARLQRMVNILQHPSKTIQDFLDYALEQAIQLTESKLGYIYHYNEQRREFVLNTWSKNVLPECTAVNPQSCYELDKTGLWGEAVRQRRPIVVNDFEADNPLKKGYPKGQVKIKKFMTIPVFRNQKIVGVVGLANKDADYDQTDILQTSLLMEGVWKVIELKKIENDLRESEERYHSYIENAPYGVFVANENARFVQVNPAACKLAGYDKNELLSMGISDLMHEESIEDGMQHFRRTVEKGISQGELSIETKNGEKSWWSIDAVKLSDTRFLGFCRDVTALRKAQRDYRLLFEEMLEGFALHEIIVDDKDNPIDYRFIAVNPAFERITGLKADNIIGHTVLEILPGTEKSWIEKYGRVALTGEPTFFEEYSSELNKHFEVSAFSPTPKQFACIVVDITERKRVEEQLRQAQRLESVGRLAGGVAHDFNNLLTPILGYTELLLQKGFSNEESVREDIGQIRKAAELARDLTQQLMAFSRRQILNLKPVDLRKVITGFEKLMRFTLRENVKLNLHLPEKLDSVMADTGMLEQVLMNLVVNAQDAMPTGGVFSVELSEISLDETSTETALPVAEGKYVMMSISDTGVGMDKTTVERIFEPFFTTKEKTKGTGLGLAMVFGIIKQHGGHINVYSVPGKGTTFRIYLPVIDNHHKEITQHENRVTVPLNGTETVLIVEDNEAVRDMAVRELTSRGYKVLAAESAEQCLDLSQTFNEPIHLVISDIIMPGMNGMELCQRLLKKRPNLKVLYISGYTHDVIAHHGMIDADIPLLSKPFSMETLSHKVRETLDKKTSS